MFKQLCTLHLDDFSFKHGFYIQALKKYIYMPAGALNIKLNIHDKTEGDTQMFC